MSDHDPLCPFSNPIPDVSAWCSCPALRLARADEREKIKEELSDASETVYKIRMKAVADARADERERIAQAIEHFMLVWEVYLAADPTDIERQLAWSRVDALMGAARIARGGGAHRSGGRVMTRKRSAKFWADDA